MKQRMKRIGRAVAIGMLLFESVAAQEPSFSARITQQRSQGTANAANQPQVSADSAAQGATRDAAAPSTDRTRDFVRAVLGDTEDVWVKLFAAMGNRTYPKPTIVLASRSIGSACGNIDASSGPFYCAADRRIYLDTAFLDKTIVHSGDFAGAYLIVREVSHHVQSILDAMRQVDTATQAQTQAARIRLERQADCFVGVWTYSVQKRGLLDLGEAETGAAAALKTGTSRTNAESVADRFRGFKQGLATGDPRSCDLSPLSGATSGQRR